MKVAKKIAPSRDPQRIDDSTWYYEGRSGLTIVHEHRKDGVYIGTDQFKVSWSKLMASARRCGKASP